MRTLFIVLAFLSPTLGFAKTEALLLSQLNVDELFADAKKHWIEIAPPRPQALSSTDHLFFDSYSKLLVEARIAGVSLTEWFHENNFIYLLNLLSEEEKIEAQIVLRQISTELIGGERDLKTILNKVGHSLLLGKIGSINSSVVALKNIHKNVIRLAVGTHEIENHQLYGEMPYSYHLREVRGVLKRFGFGPKTSFFGLQLGTAAWLHDIIEDTDIKYEKLVEIVGLEIADIVQGVSKFESTDQMSKQHRLLKTYERTRLNKGSRILKVADRIANVEEGLVRLFLGLPSKVHKYFEEWPMFSELLYVPGDCDEMWRHLQSLLTDYSYAQKLVLANLHKPDIWACERQLRSKIMP